jgi:hypothetical protein
VVSPAIGELAAQLGEVVGLTRAERDVITVAATECPYHRVHPAVSRVPLLELNAARVTGHLAGADARGRWDEFVAVANDRSSGRPLSPRPAASAVSYAAYRGITHGTRDDHDASGRPARSPWPRTPP